MDKPNLDTVLGQAPDTDTIVLAQRFKRGVSWYGTRKSHQRFVAVISGLSEATDWSTARSEWVFDRCVWRFDDGYTTECICGQKNIKYNVQLVNEKNDNTVIVGTTCMKTYLELDPAVLNTLIRWSEQPHPQLSQKECITLYVENRINSWELGFLISNRRKRGDLTVKQEAVWQRIRTKVLNSGRNIKTLSSSSQPTA